MVEDLETPRFPESFRENAALHLAEGEKTPLVCNTGQPSYQFGQQKDDSQSNELDRHIWQYAPIDIANSYTFRRNAFQIKQSEPNGRC